MSVHLKPYPELNRQAFQILSREIGIADTLRFFGQFWAGGGDYTKERKQLFADLTLSEYRKGVTKLKERTSKKGKRN
jgi:hypothetical protein